MARTDDLTHAVTRRGAHNYVLWWLDKRHSIAQHDECDPLLHCWLRIVGY